MTRRERAVKAAGEWVLRMIEEDEECPLCDTHVRDIGLEPHAQGCPLERYKPKKARGE